MVNQVNWDIAPKDATHHGYVNNPDIIAWYKYENMNNVPVWSFWYSENGILDVGGWNPLATGDVPLALPLTPKPEYIAPPIIKDKWIPGETLPPVGSIVSLSIDLLAEHSSLYKIDSFAGDEVEIVSHFESDKGLDVAVYIQNAQGGKIAKQGIARLFKELDTPEEKKERQREKDIKSLLKEFNIPIGSNKDVIDLLIELYDTGRITV